jgi:cytochrome oxidase Cu insertion factor (SCO1/SenC/PrrC family)
MSTLKQQKQDLLIQIDAKKKRIAEEQRKQSELYRNLKIIDEAIKQQEGPPSINVTDHAVVQYLIRKKNFTRKELEQEIISAEVYDTIAKTDMEGEQKIIDHKNNMVLIFKDYDLITVYNKK